MKDFLLVLFYQAIVAVNTAVILNAIIWLAKRKEKREKKNPEITPPPTTGTSAIEPKRRWDSWDEDDAEFEKVIRYAVEHECSYRAAKLALASGYNSIQKAKPPTTGSCAIKPKDGVSADEVAKLFSKLSQATAGLGGNSKLDELEERLKDFADTLDRTDKKPVTPERLREMGFETENVECRNCKHFLATDEEYLTGTCGLNEEITFANSIRPCFEPKQKKAKPSCADCRWFVKWRDGDTTCARTGFSVYAGLNDAHCVDYERKPGKSIVRPKPLGTKTNH